MNRDVASLTRLVIVGEDNPHSSDPRLALYHLPRGAAGDRLREHIGLRDATYAAIPKTNLCAGKWDPVGAKDAADVLVDGVRVDGRRWPEVIVMLGAKVRAAFGVPKMEVFSRQGVLVALPHPSGRNRTWNDPLARRLAREMLARVAPWVPWGEVD